MDVISRGALRSAALVWQQRPGSFVLTVACKATFNLVPGTCTLAPEQADLNDEDQFVNDDPTRSLVAVREIVPCKRHVEVVVVGSAYAPRNELVSSLVVRLSVGSWEKAVNIHGERFMTPAGIVRDAQTFARMPLRYERAAWGPENPVGMRVESNSSDKPIALPNILPAGCRITRLGDKIPVAGFGPIAPTWPARAHLLAKTSPPWTPETWSNTPMPIGFDTDFFAIAPVDQRLRSIAPDEPLVLEHLHPQHPRLVTRLPGILPRATIDRPSAAPAPLDLVADTLWIDSDQLQCSVLYRGYVVLESAHQPGHVIIDKVHSGSRSRIANIPSGAMETMKLAGPVAVAPAMPFVSPLQPIVTAESSTAPNPLAQLTPPGPTAPEKPLLVAVEPARIIVKARSSVVSSEVDTPRIASSEDLEQLRKRAHAAPGTAAAFSNAASSNESKDSAATSDKSVEPAERRPSPTVVIELLWFDPQSVEHIRAESRWKSNLEKMRTVKGEHPTSKSKPRDTAEQCDLRSLLAMASSLGMDDLRKAMGNAIDDWGGFVPPLVLLVGELVFPFDELEALKGTLGAVMPFVANDKKLKETVDTISELLRSPWLSSSSGVADGLTAQVKAAFGEKARGLAPGYLDKLTERTLLERKQYQRRSVFKQSCLRGLLHLPGSTESIPTYLPAEVARDLPAFQRFRVRLIAECHAQVDQHEVSSIALKVLALGRELSGFSRN